MKRILTIIFSIICVSSLIWFLLMPTLLKVAFNSVLSDISKRYGYSIQLVGADFNMNLFPSVDFSAECIEIINPLNISILKTEELKTRIAVLPLFLGKIVVEDLSLSEVNADLFFNEPFLKNQNVLNRAKSVLYDVKKVFLAKYRVAVASEANAASLSLLGQNFSFTNSKKLRHLVSKTTIQTTSATTEIDADLYIPQKLSVSHPCSYLSVKNLNLSEIVTPFAQKLPSSVVSAEGFTDILVKDGNINIDLKGTKILFNEDFKSMIFPEQFHLGGNFLLSERELALSDLSIQGEKIDIKSNINIKYPFSKRAEIEIVGGVQNTGIEHLVKLLPPLALPDINLCELKKTPLYGNLNGEINVLGKGINPSVSGNVLIDNAYIIAPISNDKKFANAKLRFNGNMLDYDVLVGLGGEEKVSVVGATELYGNKLSKVIIKSSSNVNLAVVKQVLEPISRILHFDVGPLPIMNLQGFGHVDLQVEGNRVNPHIWGKIGSQNASIMLQGLEGILLRNVDADINFKNQDIEFSIKNALVDQNKIDIWGSCNVFGKMNLNVVTKAFSAAKGFDLIKKSPYLRDFALLLKPVENFSGKVDINMILSGVVTDVTNFEIGKDLLVKGSLKLSNFEVKFPDFKLSHINGNLDFDGFKNIKIDTASLVNDSKILVVGNIQDKIAAIKIKSDNLNLKDLLKNSALKGLADNNYVKFECSYGGNIEDIEYDKISLDARVSRSSDNAPIVLNSGNVSIKKGVCNIKNVKGLISENPFDMSAKINNLGEKSQNINANITLKNANLSTINVIREFYLIPKETKNLLRDFDFQTGKTDISLRVVNNKPYTDFELDNVTINYVPLALPLKIINGQIKLKNNQVYLNKINTLADDMPIFFDGQINNIYQNPYYQVYLNSVPKQSFIDKYLNKNTLYPLKIKGDIIYSANLKGVADLYNISANAKIGERSSVYYLGATLGDNENPTIIEFDGDIEKNNSVKINNFEYNKSVLSQNNRSTLINFLKVKGGVKLVNNEPYFQNFIIKTENATDARIFNVIFKKPAIKQGLFTSDLRINGNLSDLKILGDFNIFDINAPLLQTIIKDVSLKFLPKVISITSHGEIFSNEIKLTAEAVNVLKYPLRIKNGNIHFDKLDFNVAMDDFNKLDIKKHKQQDLSNPSLDLTTLIIERLDLTANDVLIKGIAAKNLKTLITLSEKMMLKFSDYSIDLANGHLAGDVIYNLLSNKADLLLNAEAIDANELSIMLFDLPNQIYGDLTGTVNLSCNASNDSTCVSTLAGDTVFKVANGRMPKLGSLEYLLKAGNLFKGGITGLSVNGLIDLITPLKTGEFSNIYGEIKIAEGIAEDIKISTEGKDLSLYMKGRYNLKLSDAEMYVFGLLSKNIKTPLGKVGNMSLNTLLNLIPGVDLEVENQFINDLNKIPGIEFSQKAYRKFMAEIRGDIKGENYVKSFKWIN